MRARLNRVRGTRPWRWFVPGAEAAHVTVAAMVAARTILQDRERVAPAAGLEWPCSVPGRPSLSTCAADLVRHRQVFDGRGPDGGCHAHMRLSLGEAATRVNPLPSHPTTTTTTTTGSCTQSKKNLNLFSLCACHPCAGAMLIFSVSFQV
eukprot:scaffold1594_cov401-Prasinococcus_capsulatus_cf.AAC.2